MPGLYPETKEYIKSLKEKTIMKEERMILIDDCQKCSHCCARIFFEFGRCDMNKSTKALCPQKGIREDCPLKPAPPKDWQEQYETKIAELRYTIGGMQMTINELRSELPPKDFKPKCSIMDYFEVTEKNIKTVYWCDICNLRDSCIYKRE